MDSSNKKNLTESRSLAAFLSENEGTLMLSRHRPSQQPSAIIVRHCDRLEYRFLTFCNVFPHFFGKKDLEMGDRQRKWCKFPSMGKTLL
ncbi:MAG: hypothetical protein J7647_12880 [Cyanobacteria bacterium SBLK]|nr:hypothetical protein [Cyanobacteria bacterium SBLK]